MEAIGKEPGRRSDSTRDQRRDVQLMQSLGISQSAIATRTGLTLSQVQYAASHPASPKKRSGRRPALTEAQVEDLIAFITASKEGRRMPYCKLPQALGFTVGEYCIRHTLRSSDIIVALRGRSRQFLRRTDCSGSNGLMNTETGPQANGLRSFGLARPGSRPEGIQRLGLRGSPAKSLTRPVSWRKTSARPDGCSGAAFLARLERGLASSGRRNGALLMLRAYASALFLWLMTGFGFIQAIGLCKTPRRHTIRN